MTRTRAALFTRAGIGTIVGGGLFGFFPLFVTIVAGVIASALNCQLDESGPHVCMLGSVDIGDILGTLGLFGWLVFFTIPIGALAVVIGFVLLAIAAGFKLKKR